MIIQLSPYRIIKGAVTVWNQPGPDVDVVMDLKNLTFREESIVAIYSFHVLDHLFEEEIAAAMKNWTKCLKKGGELFVIVDNFEYLCRALVGGDMTIEDFNKNFTHPTNITTENLFRYFMEAGYPEAGVRSWLDDVTDNEGKVVFPKQHFELIYAATKK